MSSNIHSRNQSNATTATASSYNMILGHVLQYPGSYEIPLRTMYTLNCNPRAQPLPRKGSVDSGHVSPSKQMQWTDAESAAMNFTSQLMNHIGSLPSQNSSLPPSFIISFVQRCFHPALALVDFPQALAALDYLRDLEKRRCNEFIAALQRLGVDCQDFEASVEEVSREFPGVALWANNIQRKNDKAEKYYRQIYIHLRRWIMINELSLQPFSKDNCSRMLNTLFPPHSPSGNNRSSTPLLSPSVLQSERETFQSYINVVQTKGPSVLDILIHANKNENESTGWDSVQKLVDKYLRVAKNTIDDCIATGPDTFQPAEDSRKGKKTDSGVSFGSERRPSTVATFSDKPLPNMPMDSKGLSTLERITREFKRMRVRTRPEVEEIVKVDKRSAVEQVPIPSDSGKKKSIQKARSLANLKSFGSGNSSSTDLAGSRKGSEALAFGAEQSKRHRKLYEASNAK